jgi:hypothetical protein
MITPTKNDVQLKTQWAEHHFHNFQVALGEFTNSHPYTIVIESDPHTQETLYRLAKDFVVPDTLRLMAGDIIQNLRTALDYLACALVRANGETSTIHTYFPISENIPSTPEDQKSFARKVKGMRQEAVDLVLTIKPYKGGNNALWRLHRLNNIDKHRLLLTCGAFVHNWSISDHIKVTNPPLRILERMARAYAADMNGETSRRVTYALKTGDVLLRDFPNADPDENIKFFIEVAIDELGICEREPLSAVLYASIIEVRKTIKRFAGMY